MSVYDNKTRIYPDLNPTAPQESQTSIKQIVRNWGIFFEQIIFSWNWSSWTNHQKNETIQYNHRYRRHSPNYNQQWSLEEFLSQHLPVVLDCLLELPWIKLSYFFPWQPLLHESLLKPLPLKQEKHDSIKLLAQTKLDSISNIISQAMQDGEIFPTEFHKVLQEVEKYRKFQADIRNLAKAKLKEITKEQREEILE